MEKRILKVSFNKSGRGTYTPKVALPISFINRMGITQEDRNIEVTFDEEKGEITIKKYNE